MPKFIRDRWHGYHMVFTMCFCLGMILLLLKEKPLYGFVTLGLFLILIIILYLAEKAFYRDFQTYVLTLSKRVDKSGQLALNQLPIGVFIYDRLGKVQWYNRYIKHLIAQQTLTGFTYQSLFPDLRNHTGSDPLRIEIQGRFYDFTHFADERLYFVQESTELVYLQKQYQGDQPLLGFLYLDNFQEVDQGISDQETTDLLGNVTRTISQWALTYHIALKKIDSDKMFFVLQKKSMDQLIQSRFDILDKVRNLPQDSMIPITLSIGIASSGDTMIERAKNAQSALDIALARGGDQVAIQDREKIQFFGGKSNAIEKRTRVRARVISQSMSHLIRDNKRIVIMGHRQPDMDAIGSAIGVVRFALNNKREAHIVIDDQAINPSIERLMNEIQHHEYLKNHLITPAVAMDWVSSPDTLLILVDTHKPSLALEPAILAKANQIVVIDHHRRGEDFVDHSVLVYLEPYASSTSELVTELIQHQKERIPMDRLEATALLAGIVVDTQNFSVRAGSRTFEAASFLRRHGADLRMVQSLLKEDLNHYIKRSEMIKNTIQIHQTIAIAVGNEGETYHQLQIAQTADTLLNMRGIEASFVIAEREDDLISISARSHGRFNVQLIMEQLGGGGHLTHAACQLQNSTLTESKDLVIRLINDMIKNGGTHTE